MQYTYPSFSNANTLESYFSMAYKNLSLKLSQTMSNMWFGLPNSENTVYTEINNVWDIGKDVKLNLHLGYTDVKNNENFNYFDYKIGLSKEYEGVNFYMNYINTDASKTLYSYNGSFAGGDVIQVGLVKYF